MPGTKRGADSSGTSPRKRRALTKSSQRVKPSVEIVEVSSESEVQPRLSGVLRGLDRRNVINATKQSMEPDDDVDDRDGMNGSVRHMTRGARNGRTDDRMKYDMKCTNSFATRSLTAY